MKPIGKTIRFVPEILPQLKEFISRYHDSGGYLAIFGSDKTINDILDITVTRPHKNTYEPNKFVQVWEREDYLGILLIGDTPANELTTDERMIVQACGDVMSKKGLESCCAKICTRIHENAVDDRWRISGYVCEGYKRVDEAEVLIKSEEIFDP